VKYVRQTKILLTSWLPETRWRNGNGTGLWNNLRQIQVITSSGKKRCVRKHEEVEGIRRRSLIITRPSLKRWWSFSWSRNIPPYVEPQGLLPWPHEHATGFYPELTFHTPLGPIYRKILLNLLPSAPRSSKWTQPLMVCTYTHNHWLHNSFVW
jgi:hypothetical protein